jgi:hypothetical protein
MQKSRPRGSAASPVVGEVQSPKSNGPSPNSVGTAIAQGQEVAGNSAALLGELVGDLMAGGPLLHRVAALEQPFHVLGIRREDLSAA